MIEFCEAMEYAKYMSIILDLEKTTPNDQELGKKVRELIKEEKNDRREDGNNSPNKESSSGN